MNKSNETKQKTMSGGSERTSVEKGIKTGQKKNGQPPAKRTHSEVSNCSTEELSIIHQQLENMSENLIEVRGELKTLMKKDDIENLITTTVTNIFEKLEKKMIDLINIKIKENTQILKEQIANLEFENAGLKSKMDKMKTKTEQQFEQALEEIQTNKNTAQEAIKKANYNEQYSRKNNVKILDVPVKEKENEEILTTSVQEILKNQGITLEKEQILAIHRIPAKKDSIKPVLIKLKNNNAKIAVMQKRKAMKEAGHRLVDDVTKLNHGLINRLSLHPDIANAWFFNGSVYGATHAGNRYKFDIYDTISTVIG